MIQRGLDSDAYDSEAMTIDGARHKSILLILITCAVAILSFFICTDVNGMPNAYANIFSLVGGIVGTVLVFIMCFKPTLAPSLSMFYAAAEGLFVGSISVVFAYFYDGIVQKALILTMLSVVFTLLLYRQCPDLAGKIRRAVMILTLTICATYFLGFILRLFGINFILNGFSPIAIAFSIFTVCVAIANLMIDYDNIAIGAQAGLPKYMEYFFAVGLLVTIVWVYVEILQLLARIAQSQSE
ncbi:MAG: hypothetical protein BEN18_07810 [Epulopiscium sp. Nuni2H_MBin001]|nr:MAG: hypothetical protein BEN18_07810 [Epulopiscium sp. Nuni2H_MBin001]